MPRTAQIEIVALTAALLVPASAACRESAGGVEKLTPVEGITGDGPGAESRP